MSKTPQGGGSRALAATAVHAVLHEGRNLDTALADAGEASLDSRDRAFVRALCFGTLRTHLRNRCLIAQLVDRPFRRRDRIVEALLSVALHELLDGRAPDYAAVSATVDAVRKLGRPGQRGLVNAVLRRFLREQDALLTKVDADEDARWQHPQWLIDRIRADWPDDWQSVLDANNTQAPMWLRVNLQRTTREDWLARLNGDAAAGGEGLPAAVRLAAALPVEELPGFAAGECSVQDAASQFAAALLAPEPGMRVLDACAAPGGKSGHLLEFAGGDIDLLAVDNDADRLTRVQDNLDRLRYAATLVCGDASAPDSWWDGRGFDRILVDAPCSATGVIRRHPDIRFLRRGDDIDKLATTQRALLEALWPLLTPGGSLLYSTCSVLRSENEAVVTAFLADTEDACEAEIAATALSPLFVPAAAGAQLLPGRGATDGFYYALMSRHPA